MGFDGIKGNRLDVVGAGWGDGGVVLLVDDTGGRATLKRHGFL